MQDWKVLCVAVLLFNTYTDSEKLSPVPCLPEDILLGPCHGSHLEQFKGFRLTTLVKDPSKDRSVDTEGGASVGCAVFLLEDKSQMSRNHVDWCNLVFGGEIIPPGSVRVVYGQYINICEQWSDSFVVGNGEPFVECNYCHPSSP